MLDGENITFTSSKTIETRTCIPQRKPKRLPYAYHIEPHGEFPFRQAWRRWHANGNLAGKDFYRNNRKKRRQMWHHDGEQYVDTRYLGA